MKTIIYKVRPKYFGALLIAVVIFLQSSSVFALPFVTEYPVPSANHTQNSLKQVISHPNGDLWFTMGDPANMVGKINASTGVVTEYTIPSAVSGGADNLGGLTVAPNGDIWLRAKSENRIAKINVNTGAIQEYTVTGNPYALTFGPDGNLWYTGTGRRVGRINVSTGVVTEYTTPTNCTIGDIVSGPDGFIWFTADCTQDRVGKINPSTGVFTEYPIAGDSAAFSKIRYLTSAPDGNLWFTYKMGFAKINPNTGLISPYTIPGGSWTVAQSNVSFATPLLINGDDLYIFLPYEGKAYSVDIYTGTVTDHGSIDCAFNTITAGVFDAGGSLWYASPYCISRQDVSTNQKVDYHYDENYAGGMHIPITIGTDGNIWSTNPFTGSIVKLVPPTHVTTTTTPQGLQLKLESSTSTNISCSSNVTESSQAVTDPSYDYPHGMLDFCIDIDPGGSTGVTVTFETDLTPSQVVARKYNSVTGQYKTVTGAVITETTLNSSHALAITYTTIDGGEYDDDGVANGTILDPIGLGVFVGSAAITTSSALAETGNNNLNVRTIAYVSIGLSLFVISQWSMKKRYRR